RRTGSILSLNGPIIQRTRNIQHQLGIIGLFIRTGERVGVIGGPRSHGQNAAGGGVKRDDSAGLAIQQPFGQLLQLDIEIGMQILSGDGGGIQRSPLVVVYQPVLVVLDPELDPPLAHELPLIVLFQPAAAYIVTKLIEIMAAAKDRGIHLANIAHNMRSGAIRIGTHRTFLQVETGEFPDILFHAGIQLRRQQVLESRWAEGAVLDPGFVDTAAKLDRVDTHELAEIGRIYIPDLRRRDHQVIENGIVEDRAALPVIDDTAARVDAFAEQRILL